MAKKSPFQLPSNPPLSSTVGYSGRLHAGTFTGATRDATSLMGNAVFAETLKGLQENANSRAADYDVLRQRAAAEQSGFEKFGTSILSGVGKGVVNGVDGIVSLVPYPDDLSAEGLQNWNWDIASDDFSERSALSNYLSEGSKAIGMQMPIYDSNPYNFYTGLDAALTSVGEFAIPGKAISKGVGLTAKGIGKAIRGVGQGTKFLTNTSRMSTRARLAKMGAKTDDFLTRMSASPTNQALFQTAASGYMMNRFEGTVMGHQVYEETMEKLRPAIEAGQITEEEAQTYANQAGLSVRNKNAAMMMTDMFAMYGIFKAKGMTRNLLDKPGFMSSVRNNLLNKKVWNPLSKHAAKNPFYQALVEGGEEVLQSNFQKQSQYDALKAAEGLAASRVGSEQEAVYVPDSTNYYQRLKDNLFSKDAMFEGAIGFFSGPIQSVALDQGLGIKTVLDRTRYKKYTKEINALEKKLRPGGTKDLAEQLQVKEQIEDLKLKRAQETAQGAYDAQQEVIGQIQADIKNALKQTINMEDLIEEVQEKGVEGVEELLEGTAFINTLVKHFQNGTTENLERALKDIAEGKLDPATFGPDAQEKAKARLEELQELEKQWIRYYNFENKGMIFAAIQNEKEVDKAINRSQNQKEETQAAILKQLNDFAPANNYGFDENGNLTITPKSKEEVNLEEDLPGQQGSLFPTNDEIRAFFERMPEKLALDEINQTQNVLRETKEEVGKFLNKIASGKGQREAKKLRKEREKKARRAAKRAMAADKAQAGEKTQAKSKSEKSAISNAQAKVAKDNKVKITPTKKPTAPPPPTAKQAAEDKKKPVEDKKAEAGEKKRRTTPDSGTGKHKANKKSFAEAIEAVRKDQPDTEPNTDDQATDNQTTTGESTSREGFTKATEDKSSTVHGTTDSIEWDSESAFWTLSDPTQVAEGDQITFQVEDADTGFATDPSTNRKGSVYETRLRRKEIAQHENDTYGSNISEEQAADDAEAIAIYHNGKRIGYVGSPLAISSKRRDMTTEEMLEEKENLRRIRAEILAKAKNGENVNGKLNSVDIQFLNFRTAEEADSRSIDVLGEDVVIGIATASGVKFEGDSDSLSQAANQDSKMLDEDRMDNLVSGMTYAFVPMKRDKNGVTYYKAFPLYNQNLNQGHVNTLVFALTAWAGGIDAATDKEMRDEASSALQYNISGKSTLSSLSKFLNRFFYPQKSHPDVADGETRTYIYLNEENAEDPTIQLIENIGGQVIVRGEIKRGQQIDETTKAELERFLGAEMIQFDLENISGMPMIITDQEGNIQTLDEQTDFRTHVLKNTRSSIVPVQSVLDATGKMIYHKAPKVGFAVDTAGERTQDVPAPKEAQEDTPPWKDDTETTYAPEDQIDDDILENLDDDLPTTDVDDLVGDTVPEGVSKEHEKRHIKGLTSAQNSEIIGHMANSMFRQLVEFAADNPGGKVSRNSVYSNVLEETLATFDKYIARLEANLKRKQAQENSTLKAKLEKKIEVLKKYKQAAENEAAKLKTLVTDKLNKYEGVQGHRSEEDLENIEETAHERRNFSEDFFLTVDSKKSTSKALRKFLSNIPIIKTKTKTIVTEKGGKEEHITVADKSVPVTTTFGAPKYAEFDSVYNKLHSLEVGSNANLVDQLTKLATLYVDYPGMRQDLNWLPGLIASLGIENVIGTKKNTRGEEKDLADVFLEEALGPDDVLGTHIGKLRSEIGFGNPASEKIRRQFAINMSKAKVKAPLVLYRAVRKGGKITFEVSVTDHNSTDNSKQILQDMQEGFLNKLYTYNPTTEEYEPDELAFDRAIQLLQNYQKTPPTQKGTNEYKDIRKELLEVLGMPISVQTFHALATKGYRLGKTKIYLNKKNKNVFKTEGAPFRVILDNLKAAKGKPFNPEVNLFTDNAVKNLASMEALAQTATLSNAFRVGEKTIYTYTEHNYATSQIQNILGDSKYREQLQNTVFAGDSLWLHMMTPMGGEVISIDPTFDSGAGIEMGILNFRPVKEKKESMLSTKDLKQQGMNDNLFTRLALFTANASASRKSIQKKDKDGKAIYSFKSRQGTTVPLTYSDKHSVLTVTTNLPVFTTGKGGGVTSDTINMFYEHVLMAEISRIQNMYDIEGSNDAAYDAGKSSFFLMPEMNETTVADKAGNTNTVRDHAINGAFDPSSANYDETVVANTKRALGDQLNALINEQMEDFEEAGINISSDKKGEKTEASFVSTEYIDMLKKQHKDKGITLKDKAINKAIAADYVLNNMMTTANMFQLFVKDPALYTKTEKSEEGTVVNHAATLENIQKRLAAVIAPGTATAQEEESNAYIQLFANDVEYSTFLGDDIKSYFKGIKNKKHREAYSKAEITDGQELITYQEYLGTMVSQGQITKAEKKEIEKVIKDPEANIPDWMMDVLFGAEKPVAVADKFVTLGNGQQIEKRYYVKSSGLPLIPKFTKGTELEKLRRAMEKVQSTSELPVRLAFGSAVKVGLPESAKNTNIHYTQEDADAIYEEKTTNKRLTAEQVKEIKKETDALVGTIKPVNELVSMFKGDLTDKDLNGEDAYLEDQSLRAPMQVLERKYWRIQQATPNKTGDKATRGTQESKIILSEVRKAFGKEKGDKIINQWNDTHEKLFKLRSHQLGLEIFNPDGSIDRQALAKFLDKEANQGGVDDNIRYGLQVDPETGEFIMPLDISAGSLDYQTLINAMANSNIAQKKVKGQSTVLMTEFGFSIAQGQDLSDSGIVWTQGFDFEHGRLKPARMEGGIVKPAQVIVPNKFHIGGKKVNMSKYTIKGPQGQMMLDINRMPSEILQGFGFRIPTQGYNSMAGIEIVGFLPESMGDVVVAPGSFVTQMGSDFDIDKMFNYFYKLERVKKTLPDGSSTHTYQKVTADDLKDKDFAELTDKEIERLENALLNEALDMRLEIMRNQEIYQTTSAPLDFGLLKYKDDEGNEVGLKEFFKKQRISKKVSSRNPLTPAYHLGKYQDARGAGEGVGVFARAITFQSMAQSGETAYGGVDIALGRFKSNNVSDPMSITDNKRSKIEVFTSFLSACLDNEKEQIMNYLNINSDTFGIATAMIHQGFEEDLTLAFLESPILRMIAQEKSSRTRKSGLNPNRLYKVLERDLLGDVRGLTEEEVVDALNRIYEQAGATISGDTNETKEETFARLIQNSDINVEYQHFIRGKQKTALIFRDAEGKVLKGNDLNQARLLALGTLQLRNDLQTMSGEILTAQRFLNIDSTGIGKNAHEAYSKFADFIELSAVLDPDTPPHPIFSAMVGDPQAVVYPSTFAEMTQEARESEMVKANERAEKLEADGYIRVAKIPGGSSVIYVKPNSTPSAIYAHTMNMIATVYEDVMPAIVNFVVPNGHLANNAIPKDVRFSYPSDKKSKIVHNALRSILFANTEDWISAQFEVAMGLSDGTFSSPVTIRQKLMYGDNSLANKVKEALKDPRLAKNPFLKSLMLSTKKGERHKVTFANFTPDGMMDESKSDAFAQLFTLSDQSPIGEGTTPATPSRKTYSGKITSLQSNQVFVFGSNPEGRHGAGSAAVAKKFGLPMYEQISDDAVGIMTKDLGPSYFKGNTPFKVETDSEGNEFYTSGGYNFYKDKVVSTTTGEVYMKDPNSKMMKGDWNMKMPEQLIIDEIKQFYEYAGGLPNKEFLVSDYSGTNLNGYTGQEMADMFNAAGPIPSNIVFNENFQELVGLEEAVPAATKGFTPAQLGSLLVTYAMVTGGNQKALEYVRLIPNSYLVGTGFYKAMMDKMDNKLSTADGRVHIKDSIKTQLIQHNPTLTYRKRRTQGISPIEGSDNQYHLSGAKVVSEDGVSRRLKDASGNYITYLHSISKQGNVSLYYFNPADNVTGNTPIITRIDVLGDGGDLSEFSPEVLGISAVPKNKKGFVEVIEDTAEGEQGHLRAPSIPGTTAKKPSLLDAVAATKKVKVKPTPSPKVTRKLALNPSGESDPVATIQAIALNSDSSMFRELASAFLTRQEDLRKTKFNTLALEEGKLAGGSYVHSTRTVNLSYSNDKFYNEYAILHEFGHALTKDAVETFEKGGTYPNAKVKTAMKNIAEVQNLYTQYLEALSPEAFSDFSDRYKEYVRRKGLSAAERGQLPPLDFSNREELGKFYGGLKLSEFVTMVLSDEFLQKELDLVLPKLETADQVAPKSLFKRILAAVKEILEGLTGVTLSEYTIEQAMTIVTQGQDPIDAGGFDTQGDVPSRSTDTSPVPTMTADEINEELSRPQEGMDLEMLKALGHFKKGFKRTGGKKAPKKLAMQVDNIAKVHAGTKTTTLRTKNIKSGIYKIGDQEYHIKNRGELTIEEAGGVEAISRSEDFAESGPKYKATQDFLDGKRKMFVLDITPVAQDRADDLPLSTTVDLGMDITDFLKQLTPEQRKFYHEMFAKEELTIKCRLS